MAAATSPHSSAHRGAGVCASARVLFCVGGPSSDPHTGGSGAAFMQKVSFPGSARTMFTSALNRARVNPRLRPLSRLYSSCGPERTEMSLHSNIKVNRTCSKKQPSTREVADRVTQKKPRGCCTAQIWEEAPATLRTSRKRGTRHRNQGFHPFAKYCRRPARNTCTEELVNRRHYRHRMGFQLKAREVRLCVRLPLSSAVTVDRHARFIYAYKLLLGGGRVLDSPGFGG